MSARVAVVLSGCGYLDGAEVQEAVLSLYFLDRAGAKVRCFAPARPHMHVVDHVTTDAMPEEQRCVRRESARISRGQVEALEAFSVVDFDALVLPGGYGVAKNLSSFATQGAQGALEPSFERVLLAAIEAQLPTAAICIAPAILAMALKKAGKSATLTIGQDPQVAAAIESLGVKHQVCQAGEAVIDARAKIVSTPAYMLDSCPKDVGAGIESAISKVLSWVE